MHKRYNVYFQFKSSLVFAALRSEGQAQPRQRDYNTRDSEAVELKLNKAIPIAPTALLSPAPQLTSGQWSASAPQLIITNSGLPSLNPNSNFVPGPGLFGSSKPKQQRNGASSGPKPSSREDRPEVEDLLVLEHVPVVRASKIRPHSAVPEKTGPSRLAELGGAGKLKWHDRPASSTERIPLPLDSTHAHAQNLYDVQHPPADASLRVENGRRGQTRGVPPVTVSPNYIANLLRDRALLEDSAHGSSSLRDKTGAALAVPDGRREQSPEEIYTWTKRIPSAKAHHGGGMGASSSSSGLHASNSSKATTALPVAAGGSTSRSSARPSSAAKVRSVPTAVDRVVALKDVPSHLAPAGIKLRPRDFAAVPSTKDEVTRSQQLAEMFDDGIISKLDCIIVPKNRCEIVHTFKISLFCLNPIIRYNLSIVRARQQGPNRPNKVAKEEKEASSCYDMHPLRVHTTHPHFTYQLCFGSLVVNSRAFFYGLVLYNSVVLSDMMYVSYLYSIWFL